MQRSVREHRALIDAVAQMDEKLARDTMTMHLESLKDSLFMMLHEGR